MGVQFPRSWTARLGVAITQVKMSKRPRCCGTESVPQQSKVVDHNRQYLAPYMHVFRQSWEQNTERVRCNAKDLRTFTLARSDVTSVVVVAKAKSE